ncbi:MAG: hypothetical protein MJ185_09435 [Treponema sp.]|nr:hypothetical protein [Treponema sp.]
MKKIIALIFVCSVFSVSLFADHFGIPLPGGKPTVIENFEEGYVWCHAGEDWDRWGGSHVTVGAEQWRKWRTDGKYSLHMTYGEQHGPSQSLWYTDYPENETLDMSEYDYIAMDIYNPNDFGIVFGFCMQNSNWDWLQSESWVWFPKGEHSICFSLKNVDVEKRKTVRRLFIMMPTETFSEGDVFIDNIRGYKE